MIMPILIADDSRDDRLLVVRTLRSCRINNPVLEFAGGKECIQYFTESDERGGPKCLLLLDITMPPPTGIDVLTYLRDSNLGANALLVMLSGIKALKLIQQGYQLGADTFLVKPLSPEALVNLVDGTPKLGVITEPAGYTLYMTDTTERFPNGRSASYFAESKFQALPSNHHEHRTAVPTR